MAALPSPSLTTGELGGRASEQMAGIYRICLGKEEQGSPAAWTHMPHHTQDDELTEMLAVLSSCAGTGSS